MKKNKHKNSTVAIAALMGMTTAIAPAFPTVYAQGMNEQNPAEDQDLAKAPETEGNLSQENTISKDAQPVEETKEQAVANTLEATTPIDTQDTTSGVAIDEKNFPDPIFRQWVMNNVKGAQDGVLTSTELEAVKKIRIYQNTTPAYVNINDLTGVEHFTDLELITIYGTKLTKLNLASNTKLRQIQCFNNLIEDIVLPSTDTLTDIDLSDNNLGDIDVSNNTELSSLQVDGNNLKKLDVTNNEKLYSLNCGSNEINDLDLSKNKILKDLYCGGNEIKSLDLSQNTELYSLGISKLINLTQIDLSKNRDLDMLDMNESSIHTLDLSMNTALTKFYANECTKLSSLTFPKTNNELKIQVKKSNLSSLDVSMLPNIKELDCSYSKNLASLIFNTNTTNLETLKYTGTQVQLTDFSGFKALIELNVSNANISSLDVSKNENLKKLDCSNNLNLKSIDLSKNTNLEELRIQKTAISEFDGTNNPKLWYLFISNTNLQTLNLEKNVALTTLHAEKCNLSKIDLTQNTALDYLYLSNNNLTSLNLSENKKLKVLNVQYNSLTSLDVSNNNELATLNCHNNPLLILDLPSNTDVKFNYDSNAFQTKIPDLHLYNNSYDLKNLDSSITEEKLKDVKVENGTIKGTVLYVTDPKKNASYEYNCGSKKNIKLKVTLETRGIYWTSDLNIQSYYFGDTPNPSISVNTGTITYSYSEDGVNFTTPDNVLTHVGTFYVKAEATDPTYGTISTTKEFQILKAPITENEIPTFPSNLTSVSGNTLSTISLGNGWTWKEPTQKVSVNNSGYEAYLTVVDDTNYDYSSIEGYSDTEHRVYRTLSVQVSKLTNRWTARLTVQDWTENESPVYPTAQAKYGTVSFLYSDAKDGTFTDTLPTTVGTWYVKAVVAGTADYEGLESDIASFTIKEAPKKAKNSWITPLTVQDWTENESPVYPTAQAKYGTVSFLYSDAKDGTFTDTLPTTVGTWYVKAVVAGTANYEGLESDIVSFTIKEAPKKAENSWITPLAVQDWMVNETPIYPTAKAKYGTVSFLYSDAKDGTFTDKLPTTVGTWYVKAVVAGTADYEGLESDIASFTIKEAPKKDTIVPKPEVKKETSPIVETSATVQTNPAKLLLVFLGACLAFFKKKTQQE